MSPAKGAMRFRRGAIETIHNRSSCSFPFSPIHPDLPRQQAYFTKPMVISKLKSMSIYFPRKPLNVVPLQVQINQIIK